VNARRNPWRLAGRLFLCALLLGWVFHAIFLQEGRQAWERAGRDWEAEAGAAQWRIAWTEGPRALAAVLAQIRPAEGALSVMFMGATLLLGAWRWHLVLRAQRLSIPFRRAMEISLVAHFFNALLLGSTGGDLMKAYCAAGDASGHKAEAVMSVFVDRLLGLLSLLAFAAVMMIPNAALLSSHRGLSAMAVTVLALLVMMLALAGLALRSGLSRVVPGARLWLRRLPKAEAFERALDAMRGLGAQPALIARMLGISMLLNLACVLQFWALAVGLELAIRPVILLAIVPMIICLSALPITPSGLGVRENLYVIALAAPAIGIPATRALSLSLLAYAGSLFWSLVGGLVYVRFRWQGGANLREAAAEGATPDQPMQAPESLP
jgi:hypothetical protein